MFNPILLCPLVVNLFVAQTFSLRSIKRHKLTVCATTLLWLLTDGIFCLLFFKWRTQKKQ